MILLKRTLLYVFGVMQCAYAVRGSKNTLFSTYCILLLLLYAPIFTKLIVLRSEVCSDWPAIWCVVIGRIPQAWDWDVTPLSMQISPHRDVDMCLLKAWQSLNFYKEYLFGFETLIFATSGILYMHKQLVILQKKAKLEIASYDPF